MSDFGTPLVSPRKAGTTTDAKGPTWSAVGFQEHQMNLSPAYWSGLWDDEIDGIWNVAIKPSPDLMSRYNPVIPHSVMEALEIRREENK